MVMEQPSAQCVGREFVRQYYTLLHEAPKFLHRFYSHNSSFVHGGVEKPGEEQPPVQGQTEIHKKIISLNFRDCHAKIRQVDAQSTVDNGVVVQVTGELSNAGQPMRRFMQTFVLAPQSPKKYYVHNDIFRYQDEVFHDSDNDAEALEEAADSDTENPQTVIGNQEPEQDSTVTSQTASHYGNVYDGKPVTAPPPPMTQSEQPATQQQMPTPAVPLSNGNSTMTASADEGAESPEVSLMTEPEPHRAAAAVAPERPPQVSEYEPEPVQQQPPPQQQQTRVEPSYDEAPAPQEQKAFSWAQRASMNTNTAGAGMTSQTQHAKPMQPAPALGARQAPSAVKPAPGSDKPMASGGSPPTAAPPAAVDSKPMPPREPRDQRPPRRSGPPGGGESDRERESSRSGAGGEPDDFRRPRGGGGPGGSEFSRLPDSHQLFVGNLPHTVSDKELREQFEEYGRVVEVRINRKGGRIDVPNFGFVVFQEPSSVGKALSSRPISTRDGHRLNVEEKKQRGDQTPRPPSGMRSVPRGGGGGRGGGGMGPPRGERGGGRGGGMGPRGGGGAPDRGRGGGYGGGGPAPRR